jgi:hypothetical protein
LEESEYANLSETEYKMASRIYDECNAVRDRCREIVAEQGGTYYKGVCWPVFKMLGQLDGLMLSALVVRDNYLYNQKKGDAE